MLEETGLVITSCRLLSDFDEPIEVEVNGEVRDSWEGEPRWASLSELANIYSAHRPVLASRDSIDASWCESFAARGSGREERLHG